MKNSDNEPGKVILKWIVTLTVIGVMIHTALTVNILIAFIFVLLPCSILLGLWWTPEISNWMLSPLTNSLTGDSRESYNRPEYGIANARRKRGQYAEAIVAVDEQLVKHPGNFDGLMLKADIQAENLADLPAAAATIQETLNDPEQLNYRLPVALNKMAEWQLSIAGDRVSARRTLRQIQTTLPNSQAAQLAAQRLASLDSSEECQSETSDFKGSYQKLLEESATKHDFTNPLELPKAIDLNRKQVDEKAFQTCLRRVEMHPNSASNREELASLYLDHANQPAMALEQYERLLGLPGTTIHQKTAWLNKLADIQIKSGESYEAVRATLDRVIALDPKAAPAARAEKRISYLSIELRGANRITNKLKLVSYNEDIGLKS